MSLTPLHYSEALFPEFQLVLSISTPITKGRQQTDFPFLSGTCQDIVDHPPPCFSGMLL